MKKIFRSPVLAFIVAFLVSFAATILLQGCGAEWAVCETCLPGEESAEAADGTQIPIVVNVDVNVDVDQTQNQGQGQVQGQSQDQDQTQNNNQDTEPCTTCSPPVDAGVPLVVVDAGIPDACVPDAGQPHVDSGVPDAGHPPVVDAGKPDAGCHHSCRKVCKKAEVHYVCKNGKDTTKKSDCNSCGVKKTYNKCVKETVQCS